MTLKSVDFVNTLGQELVHHLPNSYPAQDRNKGCTVLGSDSALRQSAGQKKKRKIEVNIDAPTVEQY